MGAGQSGGMEIGGSSMGYQVLRVYPNSPGSQAGLKAYFDFIVAIGNTRFSKEDGSLREILKASVDQKLKMIVFNTRNKQAREVEIVPTTSWGGSGLLGVSIKHSSFDKADERVWHVVEVDPGSPAHQAGLKATEDYVIGSDSILQESDDLYNLIEAHEGKALKLFVYNSKSDNCREVICYPNSKWGGRGFLGCEFGHGLLHRIPYADSQAAGDDIKPAPAKPVQQFNGIARPPSMTQQPPASNVHLPMQPGHQMFQQALFNQSSSVQPNQLPPMPSPLTSQLSQQQQPQQKPSNSANQHLPSSMLSNQRIVASAPTTQPSPQQMSDAPQTFAQLANAQPQINRDQHFSQPNYYQQQVAQFQQQQQQHQQYPTQQYQPDGGSNQTRPQEAVRNQVPSANMYPGQPPFLPPPPQQPPSQAFVPTSAGMGQLNTTEAMSASLQLQQAAPQTFAQLANAQSLNQQQQQQQQQQQNQQHNQQQQAPPVAQSNPIQYQQHPFQQQHLQP